jgi:hypothetical protein
MEGAMKVRVYELAKELQVESRVIMRELASMGEPARSASSVIEPPAVRRLRQRLGGHPEPSASERSRSNDSKPKRYPTVDRESAIVAAAAIFGVPVESLRPTQVRRSPVGTASTPTTVRWANRLFSPTERDAWLRAGLGEQDDAIAEQCGRFGIRPTDLARLLDGRTAAKRLRGGESVASVAARLAESA